jgi:hypothetical protein
MANPPLLRRGQSGVLESWSSLIRSEGSIPRPLGRYKGVWTLSLIPYENNIPRPFRAGLLIFIRNLEDREIENENTLLSVLEVYEKIIRSRISGGQNLYNLVNFKDFQVFKGATTYTCLLFLSKERNNSFNYAECQNTNIYVSMKTNFLKLEPHGAITNYSGNPIPTQGEISNLQSD